MAQNYTDDVFAGGHAGQTDLQNIENNHACHKSGFSGASSPANPVAGMRWYDTTKKIPRLRNSDSSAWLAFLTGSNAQKLWIHRNDSDEGWAIDASVADVCLAFKGGTQAYNALGGTIAGSWTVGGLTTSHTHAGPSHNHKWHTKDGSTSKSYNSGGSLLSTIHTTYSTGRYVEDNNNVGGGYGLIDLYTSNAGGGNTGAASNGSISSDATWRARAAVGTLQYPDI